MRIRLWLTIGLFVLWGCSGPRGSGGDDDDDSDIDDDDSDIELTCEPSEICEGAYCEQILIEADTFVMGSEDGIRDDAYWPSGDDRPPHDVTLDGYCIEKYEVTLGRYEDCVDAGVCTPNGLEWEAREVETVVNHYPDQCWPDREQCREYAVNAKTYYQAFEFCEWTGGRLCSEAEWERAANGPGDQNRLHPWGDEPFTSALVNVPSVGSGFIDPVDSHPSGQSAEGVYNMAGNVYEWVADAYTIYPDGPDDNPLYPPQSAQDEVIGRGSCFFTEPVHTVTERSRFSMQFDWG